MTEVADYYGTPDECGVPCICTDSVHSAIGTCPDPEDREYYSCPRRKGLFPVNLIITSRTTGRN